MLESVERTDHLKDPGEPLPLPALLPAQTGNATIPNPITISLTLAKHTALKMNLSSDRS